MQTSFHIYQPCGQYVNLLKFIEGVNLSKETKMANKIEMSLDEIIKSSKIGFRYHRARGGFGVNQRRSLNGGRITKRHNNRGFPQQQRFSKV